MLNLNFPLRALQAVLAIATLGFNGYITSWYLHHTKPAICPNAPLLYLALAGLTLLTLPYLTFNAPLQITHANRKANSRFFNKWAVLTIDTVMCILWFSSFVNMAVFRSKLVLCGGHVCGFMGWGTALGVVAFIAYLITTVLASLHVVRTRGHAVEAQQTHRAWVGMEKPEVA